MIVGRRAELKQLEEEYQRRENSLVVVFGRQGTGKTSLIKEFVKDKNTLFYQAAECSEDQQRILLCQDWKDRYGICVTGQEEYGAIFQKGCNTDSLRKPILILEDFLRMGRNEKEIYFGLKQLIDSAKPVMVILTVSTLLWEEEKKRLPYQFTDAVCREINVKPFQFLDMAKYFSKLPVEEIIQIYAVLGGIPGYLRYWDQEKDVSCNIKELFLTPEGTFYAEAQNYLKNSLRELMVYNTVLSVMTEGATRLNAIYEATGFSRAKISVYLKNLMQLGVVQKVESLDIECNDQPLKGIYRISDPLIHFWYRFVFPNQSLLQQEGPEAFYETCISTYFYHYTAPYFQKVCVQYLEIMNQYHKLPLVYVKALPWYGKLGSIQQLAVTDDGKIILLHSKWAEDSFSTQDLEKILRYLLESGIQPDYYYLFSKSDFDPKLKRKAEFVKNMILIDLSDL